MPITRREALKGIPLATASLAAGVLGRPVPAQARRRTILLRSSWQTVNIGDIGHTPGLLALFEKQLPEADVMVHGSGPSVVGAKQLAAWRRQTGKPYGVFGVTVEAIDQGLAELLNGAAFVFTRETRSLENLAKAGVTRPVCGTGLPAGGAMTRT